NRVVNSDGSFYDVNGRLHAADGKFISTKNIIGSPQATSTPRSSPAPVVQPTPVKSIPVVPSTPNLPQSQPSLPAGWSIDINGRVHDNRGQFAKLPSSSNTSYDSGFNSLNSFSGGLGGGLGGHIGGLGGGHSSGGGCFQDRSGRWHGPDGKFISTKNIIGFPQATSTPRFSPAPVVQPTPVRSTPVIQPTPKLPSSQSSLPAGWSIDINGRVHDNRGRFAKLPSSSNTSYGSGFNFLNSFSGGLGGGLGGHIGGLGGGNSSGGGYSQDR
ncbi:hypothetical protein FO519_010527, partial [Halicephalobus sp. NKZ332]